MASTPLIPDPDQLRSLFPPGDWGRGESYFRLGKAVTADFNAAQRLATGRVRGSGGRLYQCVVHIGQEENGGPMVVGQCSCPVGYNCKHVVALLLTLNADSARSPERSAADGLPMEVRAWLSRAERLAESVSHEDPYTLVYLVRRDEQYGFQRTLVRGVKIRRLVAGGYGKAQDFNVAGRSQAAFLTPEDQRILALIRAGRSGDQFQETVLLDDTGADVLHAISRTGRGQKSPFCVSITAVAWSILGTEARCWIASRTASW